MPQRETGNTPNSVLQGRKVETSNLYNSLNNQLFYQNSYLINKQSVNVPEVHYGVTCQNTWAVPSNGPFILGVAPKWALSSNFMQWDYIQELVAHGSVPDIYGLCQKKESTIGVSDLKSAYVNQFINFLQPPNDGTTVNSNAQSLTTDKSSLESADHVHKHYKESYIAHQSGDSIEKESNLLNTNKAVSIHQLCKNKNKALPVTQEEIHHCNTHINYPCYIPKYPDSTQSIAQCKAVSSILGQREDNYNFPCASKTDDEPLNLANNLTTNTKEVKHDSTKPSEDKEHLRGHTDTRIPSKDCAISKRTNHSFNIENCYYTKYKEVDYGLLKFSDLDNLSHNIKIDKTLLKTPEHKLCKNIEVNSDCAADTYRTQEGLLAHDKYLNGKKSLATCEKKDKNLSWTLSSLNGRGSNIKRECYTEDHANKLENTYFATLSKPTLSNWEDFEMSGQYPGHSRPPVGTPPPQTVWNHLTMTQGQVSGIIHPTALAGAALSSAGFYPHPSMARSHLTSQLTPQHAHTQAPATWHTPTVPSKTVTSANTPGNPLYNLQMLVDNRQNQNQYRNSPGSQSTLDLSSTSEIIPENYSRIPQDIPISLTARNVDKGSRNGNIISPPIPLNGETSSDSGISSSVPTPNSVSEPVSLSTKELITPKITVKNFESNLKGVANLHDKIKEMTVDNFTQKVINLPPSVTIERVITEKKEPEVAKSKDTLSVIAQVPRNVLPVIVNLTSKMDKDITDSPKRESSSERDRKTEETNVRSPKNLPKRGKKGVDSLLEKLEGGNKKLSSTENIGSVIVMPVEEKDTSSVKSMSPERQKSKSPNREDEVVSPAFSNDDSNDNTKQRRKRKLEKPVRLSKDSKTEVEDMELEPTEPTEPRTSEPIPEETMNPIPPVKLEESIHQVEQRIPEKVDENVEDRTEENQPIRRRRSSESTAPSSTPSNQRVRRKSSDDATEFSKVTSPKGVNNTNPFNEVESELEKMFAGIVETDTDVKKEESKTELTEPDIQGGSATKIENLENNILHTKDTQNLNPIDVSSTVDTKLTGKKGKKVKVQGGKRKMSRSSENFFGNASADLPQKDVKKRRMSKSSKKQDFSKKAKKNTKIDGLREMAYDSGSNASSIRSRGPVVHVEGPRDSPLSIQVVNAPREEEEEKSKEKRKSVGNGSAGRSKRLSHQNDLDYRGKVSRAGLFSSTLSSRYDAHTTDSTWVCVFCKQGPHSVVPGDPTRPHPNLAGPHIAPGTYTVPAGVLSDLFGPYLIGKERLEDGILSADEQEITTEQKKGGKNKRSLRYAGLADQFSAKMGKKKRNSVESNTNTIFTGMTVLPGEEQRWEVWLHEQCAIWAAGVYMAGGRVTGLQEAVWDAAKSICDSCGLTGANVGCVKRGCKAVTHYPCALTKGWHLDTNQYIPKCNLHRVT